MRLRKPHPQQQRRLCPRVRSAFLDTSLLFQHGVMASQSIGLHRHGKPIASAAAPSPNAASHAAAFALRLGDTLGFLRGSLDKACLEGRDVP